MGKRISTELILFSLVETGPLPLALQASIRATDLAAPLEALARSPHTSPDLLADLDTTPVPASRLLALASNPATPPETLLRLLHSSPTTAVQVALNPATPREPALAALDRVGAWVCSPTLPDATLTLELLERFPELLTLWADDLACDSDLRYLLALHPALSPTTAQSWAREYRKVRQILAQNPALPPDLLGPVSARRARQEQISHELAALSSTDAPTYIDELLADSPRSGIQLLLANSPHTSDTQLEDLLRLPQLHPLVALTCLTRLTRDPNHQLRPSTVSRLHSSGTGFWFYTAQKRPRFAHLLRVAPPYQPTEVIDHLRGLLPGLTQILGESPAAWSAWVRLLDEIDSSDLLMIARVAASCEPSTSAALATTSLV